jgi:hypothetical protein
LIYERNFRPIILLAGLTHAERDGSYEDRIVKQKGRQKRSCKEEFETCADIKLSANP